MQTQYDDLTVIKGIGQARQTWLREKLHVRTLHDLATFSPEDLAAQLKADRRPVKPDVVQSWVAQARTLTARPEPTAVSPPGVAPAAAPHYSALNDTLRATLARVDSLAAAASKTPEPGPGRARDELQVEILQVRIFQPPDTRHVGGTPQQIISCLLKGGAPFRIEVCFVLTGPEDRIAAVTGYHSTLYARNLFGGGRLYLGETRSVPDTTDLSFRKLALPEVTLPAGMYRIQLAIVLEGAMELSYLELPLLQVV